MIGHSKIVVQETVDINFWSSGHRCELEIFITS